MPFRVGGLVAGFGCCGLWFWVGDCCSGCGFVGVDLAVWFVQFAGGGPFRGGSLVLGCVHGFVFDVVWW